MKVCFLVLAHQDTHLLARLIKRLLLSGSMVAVHFDAKGGEDPKGRLRELLGGKFQRVIWVGRREAVVWGEWSMVQATLNGLAEIRARGEEPDYVYLLSGSDYPIRPIDDLLGFLKRNQGTEFIESVDAESVRWVAGGIQRERYQYRHPFNWRKHPRLFSLSVVAQQQLKLVRAFPAGYQPHIGSQWWVLTWDTCTRVLDLARDRGLVRFFRNVWVPDEMFFQTVVRDIVDEARVTSRHLTLYQFSDYGVPIVYANGLEGYLMRQPFFFARKVSRFADSLRDSLDEVLGCQIRVEVFSDEEFGRTSNDYELYRVIYRDGLYGRRIMGSVRNRQLSDLEWNPHPYFVVAADSRSHLCLVQEALNQGGDLRCHGELFCPDYVEFFGDLDRWGGFGRGDTAIRDQDPKSFFADLLRVEANVLVGYLARRSVSLAGGNGLSSRMSEDMLQVHAGDPNASLVILRSDLAQTFRDSTYMNAMSDSLCKDDIGHPLLPESELFARFCERQLERDARLAAEAVQSGARILFVDVDPALQDENQNKRIIDEVHGFLMERPRQVNGNPVKHPSGTSVQGLGVFYDGLEFVEASVKRRFRRDLNHSG